MRIVAARARGKMPSVAVIASMELDMVTVALIDDSLLVQRSLSRLLASVGGIEVVGQAEDVAGALRLIDSMHPNVVVLDIELRNGDSGMTVLEHVVREHPDIQVIAVSNFSWQSMRGLFLKAGAKAYFDKSMEFEEARDWIAALRPCPPAQDVAAPSLR